MKRAFRNDPEIDRLKIPGERDPRFGLTKSADYATRLKLFSNAIYASWKFFDHGIAYVDQ
jgi:hypothetical protein